MYYCGQCQICKSVVASCEPNFLLLFVLLSLPNFSCSFSSHGASFLNPARLCFRISIYFQSSSPSYSFMMPPRRARGSRSTPYQTRPARDRRIRRTEEEQTSDPPNLAEVSSVGELSLQQFVALVRQVVRANRETLDLTGARYTSDRGSANGIDIIIARLVG